MPGGIHPDPELYTAIFGEVIKSLLDYIYLDQRHPTGFRKARDIVLLGY